MGRLERPDPFDPMCQRFAREMADYDIWILEGPMDTRVVTPEMRVAYVRREEGTYNSANGHFFCDLCYIKAGQPLGVCP